MTIGLRNSTFSSLKTQKSRVNSTLIQVRAFRELGSAVSTKAASTYDLRIAQLGASPIQCKMTIKLTWLIFTDSHEHDLKKHPNEHDFAHKITAGPEPASGNLDIQSIFDVHRAVVSFVESKAHSDLDVIALEASHVAFEAFDRNMQEGRATRIEFKFDEARFDKAGKNRPEIRTRYVFDRNWSDRFHKLQKPVILESGNHRALVALGSNLGNRIGMIERACTEMDLRDIKILRTSSLYETEPMYKTDQPSFVNGVCQIETTLSPMELLDQLKFIEELLGRVKTIENGPRTIDLDILLYDDRIVDRERLQIPHLRISEREFVLRPLCDIVPHDFFPQPNTLLDFSAQLDRLPPSTTPLIAQTPLTRFASSATSSNSSNPDPPSGPFLTSSLPSRKTHLMAILNLTPDSFSSDGMHTPTFSPTSILPTLQSLLTHNVTILDIGGESTRPHASPLSASDELARVLPTIKLIRSNPDFNPLLLSIDTYHASVARACIKAGANIINDVSAGQLDKDMLPTVADLGCTYIMGHMRGNPQTMNKQTSYPSGIISGIASELNQRVQEAMAAGIRRWRIVLDPGVGFAKTAAQNLEVLRRLGELRVAEGLQGLPWCVGVSRKGFVGSVTGCEGKEMMGERVWGTAGAVSACVLGGADVVRVHDWVEMGRVVKMADAVWRV
ncbi:MAG: hypothetical protein Q9185_001985 [Variospora sp. 1 TL-2023]